MSSSRASSQLPPPSLEDVQLEIDALRADLEEGKHVVALFSAATHVPHFFYLGRAIARCGHKVAYLVPPRCPISEADEALAENGRILNPRAADMPNLSNIDVFIGVETSMKFCPQGAKSVALFHSLPESLPEHYNFPLHFSRNDFITADTDYFVVARVDQERFKAECIEEYVRDVFPDEVTATRTDSFHVIPGGYPKIDYLAERAARHEGIPDAILYAPTNVALPPQVSRVKQDGRLIISLLLEHFPDHEIIFRPYPTAQNLDAVADILEEYAKHERFTLDREATPTNSQLRSALSISDISSVSLSFAMATLRPFISCELSNRAFNAGHCGAEHELGYTAYNAEQLLNAVRDIIGRPEHWREKVREETGRYVYNPGRSAEYLAEHIDLIASGRTHADWLKVPRNSPSWSLDTARDHARHIKSLLSSGRTRSAEINLEHALTAYPNDTKLKSLASDHGEGPGSHGSRETSVAVRGPESAPSARANKIANGEFEVWTRGTSFAATGFVADNWYSSIGNNGGVGVVSRQEFAEERPAVAGDARFFLRFNQIEAGTFNYLLQTLGGVDICAGRRVGLSFCARCDGLRRLAKILIVQRFGEDGPPHVSTQVTVDLPITSVWNQYMFEVTLPDISDASVKEGNRLDLIVYTNYAAAENTGVYDFANMQMIEKR